jgi:hypothetical protein
VSDEGGVPSADELVETAIERTGLDDFGSDSYREGLERLVESLQSEATLSDLGGFVLPELLLKHLTQRLQIEDWYRRHPEIDDEPVVAPLIGLGLPRTGSTALSALLGEDPCARSLRRWEAGQPCPPPATVTGPDPRVAQAEAEQLMQDELAPRLAALVPSTPTGPEECQDLMGLDFRAHYFQAFAHIPSYSQWLLDADLRSTYRYERRALKLLQWGEPTRRPWRLKCPSHLLWLDALDEVFPDARFVMTHRDPTDVMVSVADVYHEVGRQFSEDLDLRYLGRLNVEHWTAGIDRLLQFRVGREDRFFDIDFRAMQADPIGEVHRLYEWLGEPVTPAFDEGMARWWREHAEGRDANVHPDAAEFGLDLDELHRRFSTYTDRMHEWTRR